MTEWFWNFKQAALTPRFVIPVRRSASRDRKKRQALQCVTIPDKASRFGTQLPGHFRQFVVMAALEAAIQKNTRYFKL
jgi:hypothetical protein